MQVSRFINGRPVRAVPPMKIANEGVLRIIREAQAAPPKGRARPEAGAPKEETSSAAG